jgi:hypothetical protein
VKLHREFTHSCRTAWSYTSVSNLVVVCCCAVLLRHAVLRRLLGLIQHSWLFGRLKEWVEDLLWDRQEGAADVLRMKGVLNVAGSSNAHMLQVRRGCMLGGRVELVEKLVPCECCRHARLLWAT